MGLLLVITVAPSGLRLHSVELVVVQHFMSIGDAADAPSIGHHDVMIIGPLMQAIRGVIVAFQVNHCVVKIVDLLKERTNSVNATRMHVVVLSLLLQTTGSGIQN
jgi:hypothetical protein